MKVLLHCATGLGLPTKPQHRFAELRLAKTTNDRARSFKNIKRHSKAFGPPQSSPRKFLKKTQYTTVSQVKTKNQFKSPGIKIVGFDFVFIMCQSNLCSVVCGAESWVRGCMCAYVINTECREHIVLL